MIKLLLQTKSGAGGGWWYHYKKSEYCYRINNNSQCYIDKFPIGIGWCNAHSMV